MNVWFEGAELAMEVVDELEGELLLDVGPVVLEVDVAIGTVAEGKYD